MLLLRTVASPPHYHILVFNAPVRLYSKSPDSKTAAAAALFQFESAINFIAEEKQNGGS